MRETGSDATGFLKHRALPTQRSPRQCHQRARSAAVWQLQRHGKLSPSVTEEFCDQESIEGLLLLSSSHKKSAVFCSLVLPTLSCGIRMLSGIGYRGVYCFDCEFTW